MNLVKICCALGKLTFDFRNKGEFLASFTFDLLSFLQFA